MKTPYLFTVVLLVLAGAQGAPAQARPDMHVDLLWNADAARPGGAITGAMVVTLEKPWHVNAHEPLEDFLIPTELTVTGPEGFEATAYAYPEPVILELEAFTEPAALYEGTFAIGVRIAVDASVAPGDYDLEAALRYQACDDTTCLMPQTRTWAWPLTVAAEGAAPAPVESPHFEGLAFEDAGDADAPAQAAGDETAAATGDWQGPVDDFIIVGRGSGYMGTDQFLAFLEEAETAQAPVEDNVFEGLAVWAVILVALVGGLALNLTPCVLPLIPINLAIIGAGARASSRARGFTLGGAYGLGIALVYGVLGLVVVLGISAAFGAINASPLFNLIMAAIFVVLGLAMFDLIHIDFSRFQTKVKVKKEGRQGSLGLAFTMGGISALLAGACVAPVIISAIVYAQDQYAAGNAWALLVPFLIGVGMALPWPFAGAGLSFLPRQGMWMVRVKQAFGVFILAFALYYGYHGVMLANDQWFVDHAAVAASVQELDADGWTHDLAAGLEEAREEGKPVLIDFWATWCKNCLVMNETTFKDPEVLEALDDYVKIKYQAESFDDPDVAEVVAYFEVLGLPTYIVMKPEEG